jgi:hypothetical protein
MLTKTFNQHQVVNRRVDPRVKDRAAIPRGREAEAHVAEISSDHSRLMRREVDVPESCVARDALDVVDPSVNEREARGHDVVDESDDHAALQ